MKRGLSKSPCKEEVMVDGWDNNNMQDFQTKDTCLFVCFFKLMVSVVSLAKSRNIP